MKQQLELRLQQLRQEYDSGKRMIADLEAKQENLRETLLRISGAIQVIEEELAKASEVAYLQQSANHVADEQEVSDQLLPSNQGQSSE